ncbi:MAG: hypothetical protein ACP6IY_08990 [Promethearchaeia archaeon]
MVNIGLMGPISAGKTSLLRLFVKYINQGEIEKVKGGIKCSIVKTDFSGEATVPGGKKDDSLNEKETKTIHPNRVVFREVDTGRNHTIFAPGGDRERAVVKMGIITISRIATQIVAVFTLDRDLEPQFDFFNDIRFFPNEIYVCINKYDLLEGDKGAREKKLKEIEEKIMKFFESKKIKVKEVFVTCGEDIQGFPESKEYNNHAAEMLLKICTQN